jgi:hypothetical protein
VVSTAEPNRRARLRISRYKPKNIICQARQSFEHLNFRNLTLFRISIFVFRVYASHGQRNMSYSSLIMFPKSRSLKPDPWPLLLPSALTLLCSYTLVPLRLLSPDPRPLYPDHWPVMQNKPNLLKAQINVSSFITKDYENVHLLGRRKTKPNQTQRSLVKPQKNLRKNVNSL